jgi:hypothetical protein
MQSDRFAIVDGLDILYYHFRIRIGGIMTARGKKCFIAFAGIVLFCIGFAFSGPGPKFFTIVAPGSGASWELNESVAIYWSSRGIAGDLACELFRERNRVTWIFRSIPVRRGFYQWQVAGDDIRPGGGYQIRLTTLADKKSYVSEPFHISEDFQALGGKKYSLLRQKLWSKPKNEAAPGPLSLKVISPRYMDEWRIFQEYAITWESSGLQTNDEIGIALKKSGHQLAKIIAITENSGEFRYRVPYPQVFFGHDIQVVITPLRDRSIEVASDPFAILKPPVDLICSTPSVAFEFARRKRKWWEKVGDIFSGGITWYVNEVVEPTLLKARGAAMEIELYAVQKGGKTLSNVQVDCEILERGFNVIHSFARQTIDTMHPDQAYKLTYRGATKPMGLKKGSYTLQVWLDPLDRQGETARLRENNKMMVEFEVK